MRGVASVCACLFVVGASAAQEVPFEVHPDYRIQHWTVTDGLPINNVVDVLQTPDGYLWLATFDGLARFDGHRFVVFKTADYPGLASNRIVQLHLDPQDALWLTTESDKVIQYVDGAFRTFAEVDGYTLVGLKDRTFYNDADTLWIAAATGLFRYVSGTMEAFRPDLLQQSIGGVVRSQLGALWVADERGAIYRFLADGSYENYVFADNNQAPVFQLYEDRRGRMWAATEQGPYVLNDGQFVQAMETNVSDLQAVYRLAEDDDGQLWGNSFSGWRQYQADGTMMFLGGRPDKLGQLVPYQQRGPRGAYWRMHSDYLYRDAEPILGQAYGNISAFYFGADDHLWIGGSKGLYLVQSQFIQTIGTAQGLLDSRVYPIVEGEDGEVWVGTWADQRPNLIRTDGTAITAYREGPWFPTALYLDRAGVLWGGSDALYRMAGAQLDMHLPTYGSVVVRNVRVIYEDHKERFWVAEEDTLWVGHIETDPSSWHAFTTNNGLPYSHIQAIYETPQGEILFATNGGGVVRLIEPSVGRTAPAAEGLAFESLTTAHGLASNEIRDLYEDREGMLWIVTQDKGLCRLDRHGQALLQEGTLVCLDIAHGLFDNSLHRLLEDDQGRFWFNTNRGIFWVRQTELNAFVEGRISSVTSASYTERDGLINREGNGGVQPAGIRASDGKLWFPSQGGVVIIDPAQVPLAPDKTPQVIIEGVRSEDSTYSGKQPLWLEAGLRDVEITYTAMAFSRPDNLHFQYWLEGYDEDWHDVGNRRLATYTNLGPGTYTFHVRAGMGGAWSAVPTTLTIHRAPYVWETPWFWALGVVAFVLGVVGLYRYRLRVVEERNRALEAAVQRRTSQIEAQKEQLAEQAEALQEASLLKARFVANISHEFRTPLTLTFGPIEDLLEGRFADVAEAKPHMARAHRNGLRLRRLINQLLNLSQMDAKAMVLQQEWSDLVAFVKQRVSAFESIAKRRRIDLQWRTDAEVLPYRFDAEKLEIVLLNLLSNAFKFTPEGGAIMVVLRLEAEHVAILVRDTGVGIETTHLPHVFDRFYQADGSSTRTHEGSGIGLALSQELVTLHGGTITVESTLGRGSLFTVSLPLSHPEEGDAVPIVEDAHVSGDGVPTKVNVEITSWISEEAERADPPRLEVEAGEEATVVLVVEDNADMRAYVRSHLGDRFVVEEASTGQEGLVAAQRLVPDLILSDVMMPEMNGFAMLEALRQDARTSHIPVVLLTAKADAESRLLGLQGGADDYLAKPFNAKELLARIDNLIALRRTLREAFGQHMRAGVALPRTLSSMEEAFLTRIQELIEEHLSNPEFGVEALAAEVGLSRRQLSRKMVAVFDTSATVLIRQMRLARAAALLDARSGTVKEIAYAVGFRSDSHFRKTFRAAYGVAPSAYAER